MKTKIPAAVFIYIFMIGQLFAQEPAVPDNYTIAQKFQSREHFDNFSSVLERFGEISLPVSSESPQFNKSPEWLRGKFKIDTKYVGLLVGSYEYCFFYVYDMEGNCSDYDLIFDYGEYYELYDDASVLDFTLSQDFILSVICDGYFCDGYPETFKIVNGKFVKQ